MGSKPRTAEAEIVRIASRAWGVVTRRELLDAGLSAREIQRRLSSGALLPEYRGVYRVGHQAPSSEARYLAAVKACGEGDRLSGPAAAFHWGLVRGRPPAPEVTTGTERKARGLRTRRERNLDPLDATVWRGIPVTTVARTLVDLAAVLNAADLARACHEAGVKYRTTPAHVNAVLLRRPNAPGAKKLRKTVSGDERVTLSKLERGFVERLKAAALPLPSTNKPAGTKRVDARWPEHRLTVELDSYAYHASFYAWDQGYRRKREARARGDEFRAYTWTDVFDAPEPMLAELRELLTPGAARTRTPDAARRGR